MLFRKWRLWTTAALVMGTLIVVACAAPAPTPPPTQTPLPPATSTPLSTSVPRPTAAPTATATVAPSPTSTVAPTATATSQPAATATATVAPSSTPTRTPTATLTPAPTATVAPAATATPQTGNVSSAIQNFTLENLAIRVGTTVTWTNRDNDPHTTTSVTSTPTRVWDSPFLQTNQSFSFTFAQAGTFPYFCQVHPDMRATVTVTQ